MDQSSVDRAFSSMEKRGRKAEQAMAKDAKRAGSEKDREQRRLAKAAEQLDRQRSRALFQQYLREQREFEKKERAKRREQDRTAKDALRQQRRVASEQARQGRSFARRTSHRTTRFLMPNAPLGTIARNTARDLGRGAGIDFNLGSFLGKSIEQEDLGVKLSTKAFREGEAGAAGTRQDPRELVKASRRTAFATGTDTTQLMEATFAFTSQSGDLEAAMKAQERLAKLAKSQQADLEGTFFAAGKINNALEQQPEFMHDAEKRAAEVEKIMRLLVAQTKVGSVEFEKMGKQIPKIAGIAGLFEGDTERSLGQLAAVLQVAEKGQAKNAATAATQAQALALGFQSARASEKLKDKLGISTTNEQGQTRELKSLIKEIVSGAAAEQGKSGVAASTTITSLMSNKREFLPLLDFLQIFQKAGGGQEGMAALDKTFDSFSKTVSNRQLMGDFESAMGTASSKTAQFNAKLEETGDRLREKLLPAFEDIAPKLITLAEVLGSVTTFVAKNPAQAIGAAVGISIARAGLESVLRAGVERAILGRHSGRASKVGKAAALGGVGLGAAAVGLTLASLASITVERFVAKQAELREAARAESQSAFELEKKADEALEQGDMKEAARLMTEAAQKREEALAKLHEEAGDSGLGRDILEFAERIRGNAGDVEAQRDDEARRVKAQRDAMHNTEQQLAAIKNALADGITIKSLPEPGTGGNIPGREPQ